jgi:mannosyl-3-phosphoglycerate phosphatase
VDGALVFSDLDGTLLDHQSYSWEQAEPGLALLRRHGVPLIPSTSKTVAELVDLAARIGFGPIGIAENGAVIVWQLEDPPQFEFFGASYGELCGALAEIRSELALPLTGFGDLDAAGIAEHAGLDPATAILAKQRCGDEPFWGERELSPAELDRLQGAVTARGLRLARGGRYFHLTGEGDKGTAARHVIEHYRSGPTPPRTAAFGDAANDRPLLESVDHPYAVRCPGGEIDAVLARLPGVQITVGVGPAGFSQGVEDLIRRWHEPADPSAG